MRGPRESGFTLIELMTVIAIIGILAAIALPNYKISIIQAREAVLRQDLFQFRDTIDQYMADKGRYPASLEALVEEGYLRQLPIDPITKAADWQVVYDNAGTDDPGATPGVWDVKSASAEASMDGTPYNEW